jgi:spore germination protein GerM
VAKAALEELFKGPTEEEKSQGYVSWFSDITKDILKSLKIENNTAYVNLEDIRQIIPNVSSSCGSAEFLAEVETTLKQFSGVDKVIIAINGKPSVFYEWIGCAKENDFCDEAPFK